jgi:hypothetical protein
MVPRSSEVISRPQDHQTAKHGSFTHSAHPVVDFFLLWGPSAREAEAVPWTAGGGQVCQGGGVTGTGFEANSNAEAHGTAKTCVLNLAE